MRTRFMRNFNIILISGGVILICSRISILISKRVPPFVWVNRAKFQNSKVMSLVSHGTVNSGLQKKKKKRGAHGTKQPLRLKCVYFAPLKMDVRYVCVGFLMALFSSHSHSRSLKCSAFVTYCNNSLSTDCFWLWKWTTSWCIKTKRNSHTYSDTHTPMNQIKKNKLHPNQQN